MFLVWLGSATVYWFQKISPRFEMSQAVVRYVVRSPAHSSVELQFAWGAHRSQRSAGSCLCGCPVPQERGAVGLVAPPLACLLGPTVRASDRVELIFLLLWPPQPSCCLNYWACADPSCLGQTLSCAPAFRMAWSCSLGPALSRWFWLPPGMCHAGSCLGALAPCSQE